MTTKIVTFRNNLHNTSVNVRVKDNGNYLIGLSPWQVKKVKKELCGMDDCSCGYVRGEQDSQEISELWYEAEISGLVY